MDAAESRCKKGFWGKEIYLWLESYKFTEFSSKQNTNSDHQTKSIDALQEKSQTAKYNHTAGFNQCIYTTNNNAGNFSSAGNDKNNYNVFSQSKKCMRKHRYSV